MSIYIDTGFQSLNKHHEELCGDKVEVIRNENSVVVVLADGLGSGVKANILATLTSKIIGTIMANGLSIDEAVETIANTLPVCQEREIAYSTFSILQIFHSGEGYLVEFDNPAVFRMHRGRNLPFDTVSRNISGKQVKEARFSVGLEDMFVLVSDGVIHAGVGQTLNLGWQWGNVSDYLQKSYRREATARGVASLLLTACDNLYEHEPGDDTTVVVVKIRKSVAISLMVGPPVQRELDAAVVEKLAGTDGLRVVCGGTTSQIVARELGTDIRTSFDYISPSLPPTAEIDGIHLTTEGVLTLRKALEMIRALTAPDSTMEDVLRLNKRDGASRLTRLLLEQGTDIRFFVGRAMNPAHQNPEFPLSLGLKLKIVEEIAQCLRLAGKKVSLEYY